MSILVIASFLSFLVLFMPAAKETVQIDKTVKTSQVDEKTPSFKGHNNSYQKNIKES